MTFVVVLYLLNKFRNTSHVHNLGSKVRVIFLSWTEFWYITILGPVHPLENIYSQEKVMSVKYFFDHADGGKMLPPELATVNRNSCDVLLWLLGIEKHTVHYFPKHHIIVQNSTYDQYHIETGVHCKPYLKTLLDKFWEAFKKWWKLLYYFFQSQNINIILIINLFSMSNSIFNSADSNFPLC
jgi:hypothetical protein